jgi:hypothetical protein
VWVWLVAPHASISPNQCCQSCPVAFVSASSETGLTNSTSTTSGRSPAAISILRAAV